MARPELDPAYEWFELGKPKEVRKLIPLNEVRRVRLGEKAVCIGHLEDGLYAIDDYCPHQGASLGMGDCINGRHVLCPYHQWAFDLKTGAYMGDDLSVEAETFPVQESKKGFFVGLPKKS